MAANVIYIDRDVWRWRRDLSEALAKADRVASRCGYAGREHAGMVTALDEVRALLGELRDPPPESAA